MCSRGPATCMGPNPPRSTWRRCWPGWSCRSSGWRPPSRPSARDRRQQQVAGPGGVVEEAVSLGQDVVDVGRRLPGPGVAVVAGKVAGANLEAQPVAGPKAVGRGPQVNFDPVDLTGVEQLLPVETLTKAKPQNAV